MTLLSANASPSLTCPSPDESGNVCSCSELADRAVLCSAQDTLAAHNEMLEKFLSNQQVNNLTCPGARYVASCLRHPCKAHPVELLPCVRQAPTQRGIYPSL